MSDDSATPRVGKQHDLINLNEGMLYSFSARSTIKSHLISGLQLQIVEQKMQLITAHPYSKEKGGDLVAYHCLRQA